jgi:hypothetical protein
MTIDGTRKDQFRLCELAAILNKHTGTVVRWTRRGVRGHVLKSCLVGGQRYVELKDFQLFLQAINGRDFGAKPHLAHRPDEENRKIEDELDHEKI